MVPSGQDLTISTGSWVFTLRAQRAWDWRSAPPSQSLDRKICFVLSRLTGSFSFQWRSSSILLFLWEEHGAMWVRQSWAERQDSQFTGWSTFLPLLMVIKYRLWPKEQDTWHKQMKLASSAGYLDTPLDIGPLLLHIDRSCLDIFSGHPLDASPEGLSNMSLWEEAQGTAQDTAGGTMSLSLPENVDFSLRSYWDCCPSWPSSGYVMTMSTSKIL